MCGRWIRIWCPWINLQSDNFQYWRFLSFHLWELDLCRTFRRRSHKFGDILFSVFTLKLSDVSFLQLDDSVKRMTRKKVMFEQSSCRRRVLLPVCPWVGVYPPAAQPGSPQRRMWRTQRSRLLWKHQNWVTFEIQYCLHQRGSYLGSIKEKNRAQILIYFKSVFTAGTFMSSFSRSAISCLRWNKVN